MKINKIASVLCAVAMLISALPAASAAENKALSDAAGEIVAVHVTHIAADGELTEAYVDVAIPEDATCEDEHELINAAAIASVEPVTRSINSNPDFLYHGARVALSTSYKSINTIFLERDYNRIAFQFNGATYTGNPTIVSLRLKDDSSHTFTKSVALEPQYDGLKSAEVVILDGEIFGGKSISFDNGGYLEMEAKVNNGSATFAGFIIKGYY